MPLQYPVAYVEGVDVLLDDDIAGQHAVIEPVADAPLGRRGVVVPRVEERTVVIRLGETDLADTAGMEALHQFDERRSLPDLEADFQGDAALGPAAGFKHAPGARHIDGYRLLAVGVLAGRDRPFQMLRMEVRWRRDHDRVHLPGGGDLFEGARSTEDLPGIDRRAAVLLREAVEMPLGAIELVLKKIAQRCHPRARVLHHAGGVSRAPPAAPQQSDADRRVGLRATNQARAGDRQSGGAQEFAPVPCCLVVLHVCAPSTDQPFQIGFGRANVVRLPGT